MKKYIYKVIVGIFSLALVLLAQDTSAFTRGSSTWNGDADDCKGISILNATTKDGYGEPCWPASSIEADGGDTLNIRIYYHNTGSVTAENVKVSLTAPTGGSASTTKTFSGSIDSDQGGISLGSVTANLSSSQTITFNSVKWYTENTNVTLTPLLNGQSGSSILSGGLNIGSVAPGWDTQGSLVISFHVSNNTTPEINECTILNFDATNSTITQGNSTKLSWNTSDCDSVSISSIGNVSTSGSQTVYPNQTTTYVMTAYGEDNQDSDSVKITVNPVVAENMTGDISASPSSCIISAGNSTCSSTLSWTTTNPVATSAVTKSGSTIATGNNGSKTIPVSYGTSTYYLYNNSVSLDSTNVTASCASNTSWTGSYCKESVVENMTGDISASPSSCIISAGNSTCSSTLSWTTTNPVATSAVTKSGSTIATGNNGSKTIPVSYGTSTYYLYNNSVSLDSTNVTASCASNTSWTGSYCKEDTIIENNECVISNFSANPSSITNGSSATLSWNTSNCINVNISNIGSVGNSGSYSVRPTSTKSYTITAYGINGSFRTRNTTVYVEDIIVDDQCVISSFKATPSSIEKGDSSVLSWATSNCNNVIIAGMGTYGRLFSGSEIVWPTATKTYTLTAYGLAGGTQVKTTTIYVDENNSNTCQIDSFTATDTRIDEGDDTDLKWRTTGCDRVKISDVGNVDDDGEETVDPDTDTTYTLTAYDSDGRATKDTVKIYVGEDGSNGDTCSIDSFTTSDSYINKGDSSDLKWKTTDCNDITITNLGSVSEDGNEIIYPYVTTTYILRAYGDDNTESKTLKINVGNGQVIDSFNATVVTTVATNITQTGASLNGLVTSSNSNSQNVYFEYGTTVNLGYRTATKTVNGNINFSEYLTSLSPNTIYFFQAVSENSKGISRGAIEIFRTLGYVNTYTNTTNTTRTVVQGTTVYGSSSPLMLEISNRYQNLSRGDVIDYTVYYKNISKSTLIDPMVQVYIPKGITVTNVSAGTYSADDRILSVPLEDLKAGEEGEIYLQADVVSIDSTLAQIVTTAILVYTNPNGAQENAMAYVLNNPGSGVSSLGASAFFGGFLGLSLIGWLILIVIILLIVLIARSYYNKQPASTTTVTPTK